MDVDNGSKSFAETAVHRGVAYRAIPDLEGRSVSNITSEEEKSIHHSPMGHVAAGSQVATPPLAMDRGWARAFMVNVIVTVVSAVCFGYLAMEVISNDHAPNRLRRRLLNQEEDETYVSSFTFALAWIGMSGLAVAVSVGFLHILINCGKAVTWSPAVMSCSILAVIAVNLMGHRWWILAIFDLIAIALLVRFFHSVKARMNFGAANIKVASLAIKSMPGTISSAIMMVTIQVVWCTVSCIAAMGSYAYLETVAAPDGTTYRAVHCMELPEFVSHAHSRSQPASVTSGCTCYGEQISDDECEYSGLGIPLAILWICSMAWGCAVIKNVVACTVSGSVASWWFLNNDPAPVKGAFRRATKYSFGSLCKAAVILKAVAVIRVIMEQVLRSIPFGRCILCWMDVGVSYTLDYAVTFVSIYGLDLSAATRRVRELFMARAVTTVANDTIVWTGIGLLTFAASGLYLFISVLVIISLLGGSSANLNIANLWELGIPFAFGFAVHLLLMSTVLEVLRSAFKAVFVCFVQDADALKHTRDPELYEELAREWSKVQPNRQSVSGMHPSHGAANTGSA